MTIDMNVGDAALVTLTVISIAYTMTYLLFSPWWITELGRTYMIKTTLFSLVLIQIAASVLTPAEYWGRDVVRPILYWVGAAALVLLWGLLLRIQKRGRAARRANGDMRTQREIWRDEWVRIRALTARELFRKLFTLR